LDGAGLSWPEAAAPTTLDELPKRGRVPFPFIWQRFFSERPEFSSRIPSDRAEDALAELVVDALRPLGGSSAPVALVIPNELDEGRQQRLLDACGRRRLDARLLWRPIAAAFVWLEQFAREMPSAVAHESSTGHLLAVHLGIDGFEAAWLELVRRSDTGDWVLPARRRPRHGASLDADGGFALLEDCASGVSFDGADPSPLGTWRALWVSPLLIGGFGALTNVERLSDFGVDPGRGRRFCDALRTASVAAQRKVEEWANRAATAVTRPSPVVGAIVTGEFASQAVGFECLGSIAVRRIARQSVTHVLYEGSSGIARGVLARGAALYRARLAEGRPTYLDSLPDIQILLEERARPKWHTLLDDGEQYVPGGTTWVRETDLGGLVIKQGERQFSLEMWVEGDTHTKNAEFQLPQSPARPLPVSIRAEMEPAGGRARVRLIPNELDVLGGRRIELDWDRAASTGHDREAALAKHRFKCPMTQPKRCYPNAWPAIRHAMQAYRETRDATRLRDELNRQPEDPQHARASGEGVLMVRPVDSEGRVHSRDAASQGELDNFLRRLAADEVSRLQREGEPSRAGIAALGYASAQGPEVDRICNWILQDPIRRLTREAGYFLAGCVRDTGLSARFLTALDVRMGGPDQAFKELLKSVGYHLQWREYALDEVDSQVALSVVERATDLIAELVAPKLWRGRMPPMRARTFGLTERNALALIAFMLRRRIRDTTFLDPHSADAVWVKAVLREAERRTSWHRESSHGYIRPVGGQVNVPHMLTQVIHYIDQQGTEKLSFG
jgi:hypothetical protein